MFDSSRTCNRINVVVRFCPNSGEYSRKPTVVRDIIVWNIANSGPFVWLVIVPVCPGPMGRLITIKPYAPGVPLLLARGSSLAEDCRSGEGRLDKQMHPSISSFFELTSRAIIFYDSHCCVKLSQQSLQHPEVSHRDNLK